MLDATYMKMMFGENAIHVPMRMVVQEQGEGIVTFVGSNRNEGLRFGSKMPHQFVMGDVIFRPHLVMESNHCKGMGLAGIITSSSFADIGEWVRNGKTILDPMNIVKDNKYAS